MEDRLVYINTSKIVISSAEVNNVNLASEGGPKAAIEYKRATLSKGSVHQALLSHREHRKIGRRRNKED